MTSEEMKNLQNYILESMTLIARDTIDRASFTQIEVGEIIEVIDAAVGKYKIKYLDNEFEAYSAYSTLSYKEGDKVNFLFNKDMEDNRIILSSAEPTAASYIGNMNEVGYNDISGNLFDSLAEEVSMSSYFYRMKDSTEEAHKEVSLSSAIGNNFVTLFNQYTEDYESATFLFEVTLKTILRTEQLASGGDYGIVLSIPTVLRSSDGTETESVHIFRLNTNNLTGNPYSYHSYTTKSILINLDEQEYINTKKTPYLYAYVDNNFQQKSAEDLVESDYDIFIKNVGLRCVEVYETTNSKYNLTLNATDGPNFLLGATASSKTLKPILKIDNQVASIESIPCYWFREDASVRNTSDEYYSAFGGLGWRCLNSSIQNDDNTKNWDSSIKTITVSSNDVIASSRYKCVLDCDGSMVSAIILLKNLNSNIDISLVTNPVTLYPNAGEISFICKVNYPNLPNNTSLNFEWARYDSKGNICDDSIDDVNINITAPFWENNSIVCKYTLPVSYINIATTMFCSVYQVVSDGSKLLVGTVEKTVTIANVSNDKFTLLLENGNILYKYDTNGNSPFLANYGGAIGSIPSAITPISFRIFKKTGEEFSESEYGICDILWTIPKNSMFIPKSSNITEDNDCYYVKDKELNYSIANRYDAFKAESDITLTVNFQGEILTNKPSITFSKDGENGTNGSMYAALIKHNGYAYNEYDASNGINRKLKFVWVETASDGSGAWYYHQQHKDPTKNKLLLASQVTNQMSVEVYKGSTILDSSIERKVEWSIFDQKATTPFLTIDENGILSIDSTKGWTDANTIFCTIIEAKIKVGNEGTDMGTTSEGESVKSQEVLYCYYPIEITRLGYNSGISLDTKASLVPHLADGFDKVLYSEDGKNPSWNMQPFKCVFPADTAADFESGFYTYNWSSSKNFLTQNNSQQSCTFEPVTNYDNGVSQNYIKVVVGAIKGFSQEAMEADIERLEEKLDINDDRKEEIEELQTNLTNWLHDSWVAAAAQNINDYLNKSIDYLEKRGNAIAFLEEIEQTYFNFRDNLAINGYLHSGASDPGDYGKTEMYNFLALRIRKLCQFDFSANYNASKVNDLILDSQQFFNSFESGLKNMLNNNGLVAYENIKNQLLISITNYNNKVSILTAGDSNGKYVVKNAYNAFKTLYSTLLTFSNQTSLNKIISMTDFTDEDNKEIVFLFDNIRQNLSIFKTGFLSNYIFVVSNSSDQDGLLAIRELFNTNYFSNRIAEVRSLFELYGTLIDEGYYIIKSDVQERFDSGTKYYDNLVSDLQAKVSGRQAAYNNGQAAIIHVKPIVMTINRYGNSYINGWDGNKLYIDEENGQYLFAPQVGAGYKDDGRFTGMLMGLRGSNGVDEQTDVGLFGYNKGQQSIFLNARDGSATFGVSGAGQIKIEPGSDTARLYSGNYKKPVRDGNGNILEEGAGMEIDLTDPHIYYGNENFKVDKDGVLSAQEGDIGGWIIGRNDKDSGSGGNILSSPRDVQTTTSRPLDQTIFLDPNVIKNEDGTFSIANTSRRPSIYTGGHKNLNNLTEGFYFGPDGLSIGKYFKVTYDNGLEVGDLGNNGHKPHWIIKGADNATENRSYIAFNTSSFEKNPEINPSNEVYDRDAISVYKDKNNLIKEIYLGTDGFRLGDDKFFVTPEGYMYAERGRIANWVILKDRLLGGNSSVQKGDHSSDVAAPKMELNANKGYFSYVGTRIPQSGVDNIYGTAEKREDMENLSKGFFLGPDGLYFARYRTFIDNKEGYIHSSYGDLGGFHFGSGIMETGKVPFNYYVETTANNDTGARTTELGREVLSSNRARDYSESDKLIYGGYDPRYDDIAFSNFMQLSASKQHLVFNSFAFSDWYNYFSRKNYTDTEDQYDDGDINKVPGEDAGFEYGIYLGKDGLSINKHFSVSKSGYLYSRKGMIGGWQINERNLSSPQQEISGKYYRTVFKPEGTLQGGQLKSSGSKQWNTNYMWKLTKDGKAYFTNVKITGGELEIKNGNKTVFRVTDKGVLRCSDAWIGGVHWVQDSGSEGGNTGGRADGSFSGGDFSMNGWHADADSNFLNADGTISFGNSKCIMNCEQLDLTSSHGSIRFNNAILTSGENSSLHVSNATIGGTVVSLRSDKRSEFDGYCNFNDGVTFNGTVNGKDSLEEYIKSVITKDYVEGLGITAIPSAHNHNVSVSTRINNVDYPGSGSTTN